MQHYLVALLSCVHMCIIKSKYYKVKIDLNRREN